MSTELLERTMATKCNSCAFRPGTPASADPVTQLKVKLCLMVGDPFICHESPLEAWCAGVADSMGALARKGEFLKELAWRRRVIQELLDALSEAEDSKDVSKISEESLHARMQALIASDEWKAMDPKSGKERR